MFNCSRKSSPYTWILNSSASLRCSQYLFQLHAFLEEPTHILNFSCSERRAKLSSLWHPPLPHTHMPGPLQPPSASYTCACVTLFPTQHCESFRPTFHNPFESSLFDCNHWMFEFCLLHPRDQSDCGVISNAEEPGPLSIFKPAATSYFNPQTAFKL